VRLILDRALNSDVNYAGAIGVTAAIAAAQYHDTDIPRLLTAAAPT
jgi:hypothetical protein